MPKTIAEFFQFLNRKQIDAVDSKGCNRPPPAPILAFTLLIQFGRLPKQAFA
jgi:hypothetical protein